MFYYACFDLLFFLLLPKPRPRSTLFPYTTLFRSERVTEERRPGPPPGRVLWPWLLLLLLLVLGGLGASSRSSSSQGDRKSTRLYSSHLVISYAVFCLQKKNIESCLIYDAKT